MKTLMRLLVMGLGALGVWGAAVSAVAPGGVVPKIQFAELSHDFGKIEAGASVKHDYVFTNTGNAVLQITGVRLGCGCTTAGAWDTSVEPGKTGRIPLAFNTTGFSGPVAKSATVTCNDPSQSNVFLQIKGTIWRPLEITPQTAYFNLSSESTSNEVRVVRIVNNLEAPLTLSEPECTNRAFRVELNTVTPGKVFELRVTAQPPLPSSYVMAPVTLKTSATNTPKLTIPVYANVQPVVMTMPSQVTLPPGPLTAAIRPTVTIRNTGTKPLTLSDAAINLEGATVELKEVQPGRVFSLVISVPAGLQLPPTQRAEVSVKSDHPKYPLIKVPLIQSQRPPVIQSQRAPVVQSQRPPVAVPGRAVTAPPPPPPSPARPVAPPAVK